MQLVQGLAVLLASAIGVVDAQAPPNTYACPAVGSSTAIPTFETTIRIPVVSNANELCTLVRHTIATGLQRVPVTRSYATRDWEVSAGLYSNVDQSGLAVDCAPADGTPGVCDITLPTSPTLEVGTQEYILESFERSLSSEATAARFLEQSTFGSTRSDIDALVASGNDFESWLSNQMYSIPASTMREFYRKRVNPKYENSYVFGAVGSGPCEKYSRWRTYAISAKDMLDDSKVWVNKFLTIEAASSVVPGLVGYVWKVNDQIRTITAELPTDMNGNILLEGDKYLIENRPARPVFSNCVGCTINLVPQAFYDHTSEGIDGSGRIGITNPPVSISGLEPILDIIALPAFKTSDLISMEDPTEYDPLFAQYIKADENAMLNSTSLDGTTECNELPDSRNPIPYSAEGTLNGAFPSIFGTTTDPDGNAIVMIYDRHLTLYENTVENPLPDGGGQLVIDTMTTEDLGAGEAVKCHNVFRNFYNEDHCILSTLPTACSPDTKPKEVIALDDANLEGIRSIMGGMDLYVVTGLTLSTTYHAYTGFNAPCTSGNKNQWSRWMKDSNDSACENTADLGTGTYKVYQDMIQGLQTVGDRNHDIIDADRDFSVCDVADQGKTDLGKVQSYDGTCWRHVHIAEMDVVNLNGADPSLYTISGNTVTFNSTEVFESSIAGNFPVIGKFGDHVEIDGSTPFPLDQADVQDAYKTLEYNPAEQAVLMCGSPEEVASDPFYGDRGFDISIPEKAGTRTMSASELSSQKHTIWTELALNAPDTLRQKMAWSLSQIVSVGSRNSKSAHTFVRTEGHLAFYDMLIKNGFNNYKDLMREFSFSETMANWLSFEDNRSLQYNIDNDDLENYPDENFAREIMQLFSVGLYKLNMDGSIIHQASGNAEDTYTIDDIVSYSRAWTGFRRRNERGGAATGAENFADTTLDPLYIDPGRRDWFPKNDLSKGFIGDKVARCADLPARHSLRKGSIYRLLGSRGVPELVEDIEWWSKNPDFHHMEIGPSSPLYSKLCEADGNGDCTLPAKVELDTNLVYDETAKSGPEYAVDTIRTVKMKVGMSYIWYEYVRQPCVEHAFYRDGKRVTKDQIKNDLIQNKNMCANPLLEAATSMCTGAGWETSNKDGEIFCHYQGERMIFDSAAAICQANGKEQGYAGKIKEWKAGPCANGIQSKNFRSWAAESCSLQVKIAFESGQIAIVHAPEPDRANITNVENHVSPDTLNFFDTPWDASYPTISDCVANAFCYVHSDEYCICDTDTTESIEYTTAAEVESVDALMSTLHLGSADPTSFDDYINLGCSIEDVTVYSKSGDDCTSLTADTVFAFEWKSKPAFLKNAQSKVSIPDSSFSFRNPVQFISLSDPEARDAYYETEEVLNSLFYDSSHPPFMAVRISQRFGLSNPSPAFIERVSTAYSTGSYGQLGSGEYGDLGAMIAAILLDDESRQVVLDADQTHGHLREPLIKVLSFFKSMGLQYASPLNIPTLMSTFETIGQGSFEHPSVFSFFLPEHTPPGGVQSAGLVAPESMVLQGDNVLHLLDASWSTTKFGIIDCFGLRTFESLRHYNPFTCPNPAVEGNTDHSLAKLSYLPQSTTSDDIINELDLLLTSGRLQDKNRAIIKLIVDPMMDDVAKAVRAAQQLILSTPEYHSTNLPRKQDNARVLTGYTEKPKAPYKAVVVLMMGGGVDSWNLLVPTCPSAHAEYVLARGTTHAIPVENLIGISAVGSGQACTEFGVNKNFPLLADLYTAGDLAFIANTGTLSKPLVKTDNWKGDTGFKPFAHNTMKDTFYTSDIHQVSPGTGVFGRMLDILKLQGKQTSANNVDKGTKMLSGDQMFNNAVYTVSTKSPKVLNWAPTVDNLVDVVKSLNGVGEVGNSQLSEYWSSRVAAALFELEQMQDIAAIPEFEITDYPETSVKLTSSFKAIAGYMKSREYRKVNRDVFFLTQGGYDMHFADELHERFPEANEGLAGFIQEVKNQGLWNSTVIMMGSDFGRSMNTNSNSGTDHAWGGNYFIAGGSVQGGKIMGKFPSPLGPESDYWLKRGRWLPSTPWESLFNAVAQWMGVHEDADLDWVLPNRESFKSHALHDMCDLFTDKDIFTDGACQCELVNGVQTTVCDAVTYAPTLSPSGSPTYSPSGSPSTPPTAAPSKSPSASPSHSPTVNPTAELPDDGILVNNVFTENAAITNFGCVWPGNLDRTFDGTTSNYYCDRTGMTDNSTGIVISPEHEQMTIIKGIRVYAGSSCKWCDPVTYKLEGRVNETLPWVEFEQGDLPWHDFLPDRNTQDLSITSSYENGDPSLTFTEVRFHSHGEAYLEYRFSMVPRNPTQTGLKWAQIEFPGMILPPEPSVSPTLAPSISPTVSPTKGPTVSPTQKPSASPSLSPTYTPTADLPDEGWLVSNIMEGGSISHFGCSNTWDNSWKAMDKNTNKWYCDRRGQLDQPVGLILKHDRQPSIPKALRVYTAHACNDCDPIGFILQGRVESTSPWIEIDSSDIPDMASGLDRNSQGLPIVSTYESGDTNHTFRTVHFHSHSAAFLEYNLTLVQKNPSRGTFQLAEIEIPGMLTPAAPTGNPTLSPSGSPTKRPTLSPSVSPTRSPSFSPTKKPTASPSISPTYTPTADLPDDGWLVSNIMEGGSVTQFGCNTWDNSWKAMDKNTNKWSCDRRGQLDQPVGLILKHDRQPSIPKALRVYTANNCKWCDPIGFILQGRVESTSPWIEIDSSDIPDMAGGLDRNSQGLPIVSTYESGDTNHTFRTVYFHSHSAAFLEYNLTFIPKLQTKTTMHLAEIEIPGMLIPAAPTGNPTLSPSGSPTKKPTLSPSLSPSENPTADLPDDGEYVNTIFDAGSPVSSFGCNSTQTHRNKYAIDGTTGKYICDRNGYKDVPNGIIISPSHSQMSIAKKLRIYAPNSCNNCDPVEFTLAGRVDSSSAWVAIGEGDLGRPWVDQAQPRIDQWLDITSAYGSGDDSRTFTEVEFHSNSEAYLEYKLSFVTRNVNQWAVMFAEVELPGMLLPSV